MFRTILASLAALLLVSGAMQTAAAETVRDAEHNFSVTVPSGWVSDNNPSGDVRLAMGSPIA